MKALRPDPVAVVGKTTRHSRATVIRRCGWPALLLAMLLQQAPLPASANDADLLTQTAQRHQTGLLLARQGRHDEAVQLIREMLKTLEQMQYSGLRTAYQLELMARDHEALGAYPEAVLLYQQVLDRNTALGADARELIRLRNKLATLHTLRGDHDLALELLLQVQRLYQQLGEAEHADMATLLNNTAAAQASRHSLETRASGASAESDRAVIALLEQAYRIAVRTLGERHPDTQAIRYNITAAELIAGRESLESVPPTGAGPAYQRADAGPRDVPPDPVVIDNPGCRLPEEAELLARVGPERLPTLLNNMGLQHWRQGNWQEAERFLLRASVLRQQQRGEGHPSTETDRNNLSAYYLASGQPDRSQMAYSVAGAAVTSPPAAVPINPVVPAATTAGCTTQDQQQVVLIQSGR
ncbi:MAG: hypothetical protein RJA44_1486 [Pseudomonadota bacterium]